HIGRFMQLLHVGVALPCVEIVEPLNRAIQRLCAQAWQAVFQDKGAATRCGSEDAESVSGQLAPVVLPGSDAQIGGGNAFTRKSLLEVLLEQFGGREHQPAVGVRDALGSSYHLNQTLFAFLQEGGVELLAKAADQGRRLTGTGRAKNQ